jgi:hypothetical protein
VRLNYSILAFSLPGCKDFSEKIWGGRKKRAVQLSRPWIEVVKCPLAEYISDTINKTLGVFSCEKKGGSKEPPIDRGVTKAWGTC